MNVIHMRISTATHCNLLQHTATHCNTLQLIATVTMNVIHMYVCMYNHNDSRV